VHLLASGCVIHMSTPVFIAGVHCVLPTASGEAGCPCGLLFGMLFTTLRMIVCVCVCTSLTCDLLLAALPFPLLARVYMLGLLCNHAVHFTHHFVPPVRAKRTIGFLQLVLTRSLRLSVWPVSHIFSHLCELCSYSVGQNHAYTRICGAHTVFLAGNLPCIRSYTVYVYGSGKPYVKYSQQVRWPQTSDLTRFQLCMNAELRHVSYLGSNLTLSLT